MAEKITAKVGRGENAGPSHTFEYDFGGDLKSMVAKFGEEVVYAQAKAQMIIGIQSAVRNVLASAHEEGKKPDPKEIQKTIEGWKPGNRRPTKSKAEKLREQLAGLSAEERKKLLADYAA